MNIKSLRTILRGFAVSAALVSMVVAVSLSGMGCGSEEPAPDPPSDNANLSNLVSSPVDLDQSFSQSLVSYSMTVENGVESVTLTPTAADSGASITVAGATTASASPSVVSLSALPELVTDIAIVVTAEDGTTQKTYTVQVTRSEDSGPSNNADLLTLTISSGSFVPSFTSHTFDYEVTVAFETAFVTVTPTVSQADAIVSVNGVENISGNASPEIGLEVGDTIIAIAVVAEDGASTNNYSIIVTRQGAAVFGLQGYIKSSNTADSDSFGYTVALSNDTLVVGAPTEDSNAVGVDGDQMDDTLQDSGAVYVFVRDELGVWTQQAYIKASNTGAGDRFGSSVSIDNDEIVIGAPGEASTATGIGGADQADNSAADAGAVYVFTRTGSEWTQQAYIKASNTDAGDLFGSDVKILRDTLVVSAIGEDSDAINIAAADQSNNMAQDSGAVYIFTRDDSSAWSQHSYVKAPNTDADDEFGYSLALDIDGLAIGAPGEASNSTGVNADNSNNSIADSGAAYIFYRSAGDVWAVDSYIKASNAGAGDRFGETLDIEGQLLAVGAPMEDGVEGGEGVPIDDSGAIYSFKRNGGTLTWSEESHLKGFLPESGDQYGQSVRISADLMIVGAPREDSMATGIDGEMADNSATDSGAVYTYTRNNVGGWDPHSFVKASNSEAGDHFGAVVTLSGDSMVIGVPEEDSITTGIGGDPWNNSAPDAGACFVYNGLPITEDVPTMN